MDTLLALVKDTPANVLIVAIICIAIVLTTLVIAVSLLIYFRIKNSELRKLQEAERNKEKEEKWFSLRKEYQNNLLDDLKAKDQNKEYIEQLRKCIEWIDKQKK